MIPMFSFLSAFLGLNYHAAGGAGLVASSAVGPVVDRLYDLAKDTLTTDEAMAVLGMSKPTILKKMKEEKVLPYSGPGGRLGYHIRKEDIAEYAKKNNITPKWNKVIDNDSSQDTSSTSVVQIQNDYVSFLKKIKQDPSLLDDLIELTKTYQNQAKLKLERLKLEESNLQNTKEYKMKVILANMEINNYEAEILQYNLLKRSLSSKTDK